jgi:hypothetical protein
MKQANLILLQGLIAEVALLKGTTSKEWVDQFRDRMLLDVDKTVIAGDAQTTAAIKGVTRVTVSSVTEMAKNRVAQVRG